MKTTSGTKLLYQIEDLPIFQNKMYESYSGAINCPKASIRLVEDLETGLVYNEDFNPHLMKYDSGYQNEQAVSPVFKRHLHFVSDIIARQLGRISLVEVGCGKGFFLEMLLEKNFEVTGFDPTYEGGNPNIQKKYFSPDTYLKNSNLILRHVLEHIHNPIDFLFRLKDANGGTGRIYIEVPCFEWICKHRAWFDIFYEHVNYFRLSDFYRIFDDVIESGRLFRDQYIYVIAELSSLRYPKRNTDCSLEFPEDFTQDLENLTQVKSDKRVIWGAASKGVIFSLLMSRLDYLIDIAIDINPSKQQKYLPATGLFVHRPEEIFDLVLPNSPIFIMNSNYLEEIKTMSKKLYTYITIDHD